MEGVGQMRVNVLVMALIVLSLSGCTFFGFSHHTVSGLICRSNFEIGQQCTIFDPFLKEQVPIDPNNGVITTCDKNGICFYTYTDSMGNTWNGKVFREKREKQE